MKKHAGVTLTGLLITSFVIVFAALLVFKLIPAYTEYFKVQKAVKTVAERSYSGEAAVSEIQRDFDKQQQIDDFEAVNPKDLDITKQGNQYLISANYTKKIHLFSNISLLIDFETSALSKPGG